ncbi:MAG: OmpA family protein [Parvibaculum sp.]
MTKLSWSKVAFTSFLAPSVTMLVVGFGIYHFNADAARAEVQINLSGIGKPTENDRRIAPGRAPVQLRTPDRSSVQQIRLTPPPSLRGEVSSTGERAIVEPPKARPAPTVLQPASSAPAAPIVPPAQVPVREAAIQAPAPVPSQAPNPVAAPVPAQVPTEAPPQAATQAPAPVPTQAVATPEAPEIVETPKPEPEPKPVQVASLPAPAGAAHRLRFDTGDAGLPPATRDELELIALELMRHADRIEIQAFAGNAGDVSSANRRLSLKRGLAVRKFLVEQGVLQNRIDVRALGGTKDSGPTERVDILLSSRQR